MPLTEPANMLLSVQTISEPAVAPKQIRGNGKICSKTANCTAVPRYIGDIGPDDFKSNKSRLIVKKYVNDTRSKVKMMNQTIRRLKEKINSVSDMLEYVKKKGLLSIEATNALTALPHPQTVRKWYRHIDFQPGISKTALNAVQAKIEDLAKKTGRKIMFALMVDEMSIRRSIEWDGKNYHGFVDLGTGMSGDDMPEATYALVFMIVSINGHFKTPVAYYLVHNLSGKERTNLINECLFALHEHNIHVVNITCDGAASNISMVKGLGAKIRGQDIATHFLHPVMKQPIFVLLDACHMIKLVRNIFASYMLTNDSGSEIRWSYINELIQIQEREGLHAATKVRRKHIRFQKEKMKVKLAVQVLSTSVVDALNFFEYDIRYPEFTNADAIARFCQIFNNVLDILNSRNKSCKNPTQQCITPENISLMEMKVNEYVAYIKQLKWDGVPVLHTQRKTSFLGVILCMKSVIDLAKHVFSEGEMSYLLTYKLSQDHLETFFSCIRVYKSPLADHRGQLIDAILKRYFSVRLHHEGVARQQNINRIRAYHNKLVLFTNQ
ncbi:thap domain-containing protein 9-like protein [Lasius niger]|uniref:Thap domain-containing protein 9-like protein n=1 Tax=Lasius niger TaxID=67767 RepID=A0A0J7KTA5_LASNI|nr:thap domain-containing protein 9-like protein [Lasius niger]